MVNAVFYLNLFPREFWLPVPFCAKFDYFWLLIFILMMIIFKVPVPEIYMFVPIFLIQNLFSYLLGGLSLSNFFIGPFNSYSFNSFDLDVLTPSFIQPKLFQQLSLDFQFQSMVLSATLSPSHFLAGGAPNYDLRIVLYYR
jgi:hypothetical protein